MELTSTQKKAVEIIKGPVLIIAGAGTGKTTVLVEKIKYLINENICKTDEILALTFTEKAAHEMEERVDKAMPYGYFQMSITTFHSFCDSILRDEIHHIGLSPNYKLQTAAGIINFFRKNLFLFDLKYFRPLGNPNKFIEGMLQHFSRLHDENITPEKYLDWANKNSKKNQNTTEEEQLENEKNLELALAFKKFQDLKAKENILDFSDLIYYTLKIFNERKNLLAKYKKKFKYILVDEFQDTNLAQYELIKKLAPSNENPNLAVIGDDNQSIYKFRGASISNIMQFLDDYKNANKVILLENYRSNQAILNSAYKLIQHNNPDTLETKLNISKNLISKVGKGNEKSVIFSSTETGPEEADYITEQILLLKEKFQFKDFAILIRSNSHVNLFTQTLSRKGIPYQFLGPNILFKQPEIKDLIAYLKFLYNITDSSSLYRVLCMDIFNIDKNDLAKIVSLTKITSLSLYETIEVYLGFFDKKYYKAEFENYNKNIFAINDETKNKIENVYQIIKNSLNNLKNESVGQIVFEFLEKTGYINKIIKVETEKEQKIAENITRFFSRIKSFENENEDVSVIAFVDFLEISLELNESPMIFDDDFKETNAVNILTVHSSKGLEFPVVFLVNLTADRFPTRNKKEQIPISNELLNEILPSGDFHIQEERRLFYVGITRAKEKVYLTSSSFYPDNKREKKISPFVIETIGVKEYEKIKNIKLTQKKQLSIFDFKKNIVNENIPSDFKNINTFSYTQLDTFKSCPLRYKYQYVIKIPTSLNTAASFGQSIHKTLQIFYKNFKENKDISLKDLISYLKICWIPIGYSSRSYENKMKKEGEEILKNYYENFHNNNLFVLDLEKNFKIKIGNIFINGIIDRVDYVDKNTIEVIDYKTGKLPDKKDIDKNLQMAIYAIASTDKGLYDKKLNNILLTLYYLQENKKISVLKNDEDITKAKEEILNITKEINESKFLPKKSIKCDFCPYKINCEAW